MIFCSGKLLTQHIVAAYALKLRSPFSVVSMSFSSTPSQTAFHKYRITLTAAFVS